MKLELVDQFGREQTLYVHDLMEPVLVDDQGRSVIDYEGMFPRPRGCSSLNDPFFKHIIDGFLERPSPGLSILWLDWEGTPPYETFFNDWRDAMMVMTGKLLVRASK